VVKLSGILPEPTRPFASRVCTAKWNLHLEQSRLAYTHLRGGEYFPSYFRQVRSISTEGLLRLPMAEARIARWRHRDLAEVAATVLTSPATRAKSIR